MRRFLLIASALALVPFASLVSVSGDALAQAPTPPAVIKAEFKTMLTDAEQKILELAEVTPSGKYSWSPKGARKTSELYMHVAAANYLLPQIFGTPAPAGVDFMKFEDTIKEKEQVVKTLRESFAAAHAAIEGTQDLDTMVDLFGRQVTKRYAMLLLVSHAHEHLGQAIAYSRSNGIAPPWSERAENAAAAKAKAEKK